MKNHANSIDNGRSSVSSTQLQPHDISINEPTTSTGVASKNLLLIKHFTKPFVFLTLVIIPLSLTVLLIPSCDEVLLQVKLRGFEYQLIKKGNCRGERHE